MTGINWYISRQKVEALRQSYGASKLYWLKELSIKLKSPFAEASASVRPDQSLHDDIEKIRSKLIAESNISSFPNLSDESPFFSFTGRAHRAVDRGAYWIILFADSAALLLGGSASNAIGTPTKETCDISPSLNPIGSVQVAFADERSPEQVESISSSCSYVWQAIARPVRTEWQTLPLVEGVAVYGGTFPARRSQFRRAGFDSIERIVIGSPIYVRQK